MKTKHWIVILAVSFQSSFAATGEGGSTGGTGGGDHLTDVVAKRDFAPLQDPLQAFPRILKIQVTMELETGVEVPMGEEGCFFDLKVMPRCVIDAWQTEVELVFERESAFRGFRKRAWGRRGALVRELPVPAAPVGLMDRHPELQFKSSSQGESIYSLITYGNWNKNSKKVRMKVDWDGKDVSQNLQARLDQFIEELKLTIDFENPASIQRYAELRSIVGLFLHYIPSDNSILSYRLETLLEEKGAEWERLAREVVEKKNCERTSVLELVQGIRGWTIGSPAYFENLQAQTGLELKWLRGEGDRVPIAHKSAAEKGLGALQECFFRLALEGGRPALSPNGILRENEQGELIFEPKPAQP